MGRSGNALTRRALLAGTPLAAVRGAGSFFRIGKVKRRQCLLDPAGKPVFSLAMNHIDSAALRLTAAWQEEFGGDLRRWLRGVRRDLEAWGFNAVGWVQEYVVINDQHHRHSRSFTPEEYGWLEFPYFHLLPFIESHGWEIETRLPKVDSPGFAEWCDYVARDQCPRFRDDPSLIGYFYSDVPAWVQAGPAGAWRGTLFDARELESETGRRELLRLAGHYYRTLHAAIRRHDPNHLIFGDRLNANTRLPEEVVKAALPYVDVLSFQCFSPPAQIHDTLGRWAGFSNKPVLLADAAHWSNAGPEGWPPKQDRAHDPALYAKTLEGLLDLPYCVGYHLCGAYLKNNARRYGFRDAHNRVEPYVEAMAKANRRAAARFAREAG
ncbi:MAG: agarase [Acidobacteria bacterium]|nr:agarase [Acidobacteriota bacterium]